MSAAHNPVSNILTRQSDGCRFDAYKSCMLCPRACGVNRYEKAGFCHAGTTLLAARAGLHFFEEPCISGSCGSGTVFFSNCTLRCVFCQNYKISAGGFGKALSTKELSDTFLRLADAGAANISLVTPTHYLPEICAALELVRHRLQIPVVMNCGGYERVETLRMLDGFIDIYLPDLKYESSALSARYSAAADYREHAFAAIREMLRQCGVPGISVSDIEENETAIDQHGSLYAKSGLLQRGVIIRHMVLPGQKADSIALLRHMKKELPKKQFLLSLMSQYTPFYRASAFPELNRRLLSYEYDSVLKEALRLDFDGYLQECTSAREEYTPDFDLSGLCD